MAAFRVLVEAGADLRVKDRWGNSIVEDAKRAGNAKLLDYVKQRNLFASDSFASLSIFLMVVQEWTLHAVDCS